MYDLIGLEEERIPSEEEGDFAYRPLGQGMQDVPSILAALKQTGTKWIIVEQDEPSRGLTPLECVRQSIDYLDSLDK